MQGNSQRRDAALHAEYMLQQALPRIQPAVTEADALLELSPRRQPGQVRINSQFLSGHHVSFRNCLRQKHTALV